VENLLPYTKEAYHITKQIDPSIVMILGGVAAIGAFADAGYDIVHLGSGGIALAFFFRPAKVPPHITGGPMRRISYALLLIILLVPALAMAAQTLDEKLNAGWVVKDVTIQEPVSAGEPSWAYVRVQTIIDTSPKAVWAALTDMGRWPKWLPMSQKAGFLSPEAAALITPEVAADERRVEEIDRQHPDSTNPANYSGHWQRMAYEYYNLPWPIKNEWVVRTYTYDETAEKNRASWRKMDSKTQDDDGYWEVSPRPDGKTMLKYYYRVKAKESVPKPVFRTAVTMTVNAMIKALRHEAERREAQIASQR